MMSLSVEPLLLHLKTPFRIAHGTSTTRQNVLVRLGDGVGEGALPPYYPYDFADVRAYLEALDADSLLADPFVLEDALDHLPPGPAPALAAIDIALHDHWAKQLGYPLYQLWGLNPARAPVSSVTLSIPDDEEHLRRQIQDFADFPILKLKLGAGDIAKDEAIVRAARRVTDAQICVDANGAWSVEEAAVIIPRLAGYNVQFVEQPLGVDPHEDWLRLRERLPADAPPLFADESIQTASDILALRGAIDGVNLKLTKAGGLRGTRRLLTLARSLGLQVMLGCMIESSVALTAAAHLAPLVDYADLDGYLLLAHDPFRGVTMDRGRIQLPTSPGLGCIAV
jgi:L-alanine-DL-glutamate epimerase-like enolase superfamily enzyme